MLHLGMSTCPESLNMSLQHGPKNGRCGLTVQSRSHDCANAKMTKTIAGGLRHIMCAMGWFFEGKPRTADKEFSYEALLGGGAGV